jgi:Mor family transcriptional regulator
MVRKRETRTQQKHADIYQEYLNGLAEHENLGPRYVLNKKDLYEVIAEKFRCSSGHVYKVINRMLKRRKA